MDLFIMFNLITFLVLVLDYLMLKALLIVIFILHGDKLITFFNLKVRYPKLAKRIEAKHTLEKDNINIYLGIIVVILLIRSVTHINYFISFI